MDSLLASFRPPTKKAKRVRMVITACGCSAAVMLSILTAWYKSTISIHSHRMKIEAGREEKERRSVKKTAVLSSAVQPEPYLVLVVGMSGAYSRATSFQGEPINTPDRQTIAAQAGTVGRHTPSSTSRAYSNQRNEKRHVTT